MKEFLVRACRRCDVPSIRHPAVGILRDFAIWRSDTSHPSLEFGGDIWWDPGRFLSVVRGWVHCPPNSIAGNGQHYDDDNSRHDRVDILFHCCFTSLSNAITLLR